MPGWSRATITHNDVVTPGLHRLTLSVTEEVAKAFQAPGQYHRVRIASGQVAVFAIASAPGSSVFEYLVRTVGEVAEAWTALAPGAHVEVEQPQGPGFPVHLARGRRLIVIGTGTGYAPLRSVLQAIRGQRAHFGPVHGLYGANDPADLAWADEFAPLAVENIHITPTVSRTGPGWTGAIGRVQQLVETLPTDDAVAFLCGQAEMVAEVTRLLAARGLPPERVFLNYPTG